MQESVELKSLHYCKELELATVDGESGLSRLSTARTTAEEVVEEESSSCSRQTDPSHKRVVNG